MLNKVDLGAGFDDLLVYARMVEQEFSSDGGKSNLPVKGKVTVHQNLQQTSNVSTNTLECKLDEINRQMRSMDGRMQKLGKRSDMSTKQGTDTGNVYNWSVQRHSDQYRQSSPDRQAVNGGGHQQAKHNQS